MSPGVESRPHLPCSTTSGGPPAVKATTGRVIAIAPRQHNSKRLLQARKREDVAGRQQRRDVRALLRVIVWQRTEDDFGGRASELDELFRQLPDRELDGVAEIDGASHAVRSLHQPDQPFDQVVDIAEGAGLLAFAVDRNVLVAE